MEATAYRCLVNLLSLASFPITEYRLREQNASETDNDNAGTTISYGLVVLCDGVCSELYGDPVLLIGSHGPYDVVGFAGYRKCYELSTERCTSVLKKMK